jgi:alkylhydroperoxidase/carboxymuconolactone decarboxylase family protein YurZ
MEREGDQRRDASPASEQEVDGTVLLERMRGERGYTLSYHEIYGRLEPRLLTAYAELYRACTLDERVLSPRWRELVWVALLGSIREQVGSIHLDRAEAAGVGRDELSFVIRLAAVAECWDPLAFAHDSWSDYLAGRSAEAPYLEVIETARGPLEEPLADLVMLVVQAARQREKPFLLHLRRCYDSGLPETHIAEGLSYVLQPVGANRLLWATDLWLEALRKGVLPPSPVLGRGEFETRLS